MVENNKERLERYARLRRDAEDALGKIVADIGSPANVRAQAARTLLELVGAMGPRAIAEAASDAESELEPASMTLADIDAEIARLGVV
jgi:hypothetical protein